MMMIMMMIMMMMMMMIMMMISHQWQDSQAGYSGRSPKAAALLSLGRTLYRNGDDNGGDDYCIQHCIHV